MLVGAIKAMLVDLGATKGVSGMALGVDQHFVLACKQLNLPYIAAVPFVGQESRWPTEAQQHYRELLRGAEEIVHVCGPGYVYWKMQARNEWVVDTCSQLIAVWDGSSGGTANTVLYAHKVARPIHIINPTKLDHRCVPVINP